MPDLSWRRFILGLGLLAAVVAMVFGVQAGLSVFGSKEGDSAQSVAKRQTVTASSYLSPEDRNAKKAVSVSTAAPASWKLKTDDGSKSKVLNPANVLVGHFVFTPEAPGGSADGDIVLETISGWLSSEDPRGSYGGLSLPAQKLAYVNYLKDLRKSQTINPADAKNIVKLNGQVAGVQGATYATTGDGKLSGVVFETVIMLNGKYQPVILADLAGLVNKLPVYLRGVVTYQDSAYGDLYANGTTPDAARTQQAIDAFAGGKIDDGMTTLAKHLRDMIETMKIDYPATSGTNVIH